MRLTHLLGLGLTIAVAMTHALAITNVAVPKAQPSTARNDMP